MRERRRYSLVLILMCGTWIGGGIPSLGQADTSASYEMEAHKRYGNCRVWTQMDMLTDEESHHLQCKEETFTDQTMIGISAWGSSRHEVRVSKGVMFHIGQSIPVAIRIDKGPVRREQGLWYSENMTAIIPGTGFSQSLMNDLAKGQRVVIQVGTERGNVRLNGSADAINDFRQRTQP